MISTNETKPKPNNENQQYLKEVTDERGNITVISSIPEKVITTNDKNAKPKEFAFTQREFPGVKKMETRNTKGMFLTTSNMEQISRNARRLAIMAKVKALKAEKAKAEAKKITIEGSTAKMGNQIIGQSAVPADEIDPPKKKPGRKKKEEAES